MLNEGAYVGIGTIIGLVLGGWFLNGAAYLLKRVTLFGCG